MTDDAYGPGICWLAERAGLTPEKLLSDPVILLQQLAQATRETAELAAEAASPVPDVRKAAQKKAADLHARLSGGPTPGQRFFRSLAQALREEADRLRPDQPH